MQIDTHMPVVMFNSVGYWRMESELPSPDIHDSSTIFFFASCVVRERSLSVGLGTPQFVTYSINHRS